jgi:hypothetical protein
LKNKGLEIIRLPFGSFLNAKQDLYGPTFQNEHEIQKITLILGFYVVNCFCTIKGENNVKKKIFHSSVSPAQIYCYEHFAGFGPGNLHRLYHKRKRRDSY